MSLPKVHLTINIADVEQAISEYLARKFPNMEVEGVTVMSWNQEVFSYSNMKLTDPPHIIRPDHRSFPD